MPLSWGDCCRHHQETRHSHYLRIPGGGGRWECEDCIEIERGRTLAEEDLENFRRGEKHGES